MSSATEPKTDQRSGGPRVGVFVCHCGINIAGTVNIPELVKRAGNVPGVVAAADYQYCCSDPGQNLIRETIAKERLDRVVVACCSPTLHEKTFRKTCAAAGLNPFLCEIANIREQCAWVTKDKDEATDKASDIVALTVARATYDAPLVATGVPVKKRALVVGAGIAGIQVSLDIANAGYEVLLVEKEPSVGGHMSQIFATFPSLELGRSILVPKMMEMLASPGIRLMTYSEVEKVSGHIGDFKVRIRRKARYVDPEACTGCGLCVTACPATTKSEFDRNLAERKAIYLLDPQALPGKPVIDPETCFRMRRGECGACAEICPENAVKYDDEDELLEETVGAIVLATGYQLIDQEQIALYGIGRVQDVIDGMGFERLLSATGPTSGEIRRPSDGKVPKKVVFVQCVGSRDQFHGVPYCSKICCMYTAKNALIYKQRVPEGEATVCYIDVRTPGKGAEEFYRAATESGVKYVRGKVSKVFRTADKIVVWSADTLAGEKVELEADMVVLASALVPSRSGVDLARQLKIQIGASGFLAEAHPKLRPVETLTGGFYLAGTCQGPKDILETVVQSSAAAAKVLALFGQDKLYGEPTVALVDAEVCVGCGNCEKTCAYEAVKVDPVLRVAVVTEALCAGCGACAVSCPSGAVSHLNFSKRGYCAAIEEVVK
ncbi:MAG: CoB--CoM heterodisulfide reductase iron-sulfur subunit A family protein [candidate division WOR-3 bacterium]|nr:MAG: CoB--CoM heterodisulfide reductase iron-sulfur subunit A family protein [candidate division WOR-3 bacterium]